MQRRHFLRSSTAAAVGVAAAAAPIAAAAAASSDHVGVQAGQGMPLAQQSACYWSFSHLPMAELLPQLATMGLSAIDLARPSEYALVKEAGFTSSMSYGREEEDITTGFIDEHLHDQLIEDYSANIPAIAANGWKNMICFAGNRRGRNDLDGLRVAAKGLKRLMPIAKEYGITVQLELFNSKVDHPDYMGDSSAWSIALCDMVDSDNFKLLYDIYHMQVQEGNIIQTIQNFHDYFGHYHTAGVPGRHELGDTQELRYPAVMRAIRETGFEGYVAHEFIPTTEDKLAGLREAVRICS